MIESQPPGNPSARWRRPHAPIRKSPFEPAGSLWASAHVVRRVSPVGLQPVPSSRLGGVIKRVMTIVNDACNTLEAPIRSGCRLKTLPSRGAPVSEQPSGHAARRSEAQPGR